MPSLQQRFLMLYNQTRDLAQFMRSEAPVFGKRDRVKPELRDSLFSLNVDVGGFSLVGAKENKTV
jgi:hypothetical protein